MKIPSAKSLSAREHVLLRLFAALAFVNVAVALLLRAILFWPKRCRIGPTDRSRVRRVLVVRLDEIGDATMNTAFLRELRRGLPNAEVTLVVKRGLEDLLNLCPH